LVTGQLNVSFGGDGRRPKPATRSRSGFVCRWRQICRCRQPQLHLGDHDLVVLDSSAGHLSVGFVDGGNSFTIFELTVNGDATSGDFGKFTFQLEGPIDHVDAEGNNLPDEQSLPIRFDVTATDADFDTAHADITIQVNDDKPEIGVTYYDTRRSSATTRGSASSRATPVPARWTRIG